MHDIVVVIRINRFRQLCNYAHVFNEGRKFWVCAANADHLTTKGL